MFSKETVEIIIFVVTVITSTFLILKKVCAMLENQEKSIKRIAKNVGKLKNKIKMIKKSKKNNE